MNRFEYTHARSVGEAIAQMKDAGVVAKAGGVDLIDRMKEGLVSPSRLVSLSRIKELDFLHDDARAGLRIGPLTTIAALEAHAAVRSRYPALAEAAAHVATPQIRNMATLGGNLVQRPRCWYFRSIDFVCRKKGGEVCHAHGGENQFHAIVGNRVCAIIHPSTPATALIALGASLTITGPKGDRQLPLEQFFTPPEVDITRENVLQQGELITEIRVPAPAEGARSAYRKQGEKESFDWPIADAAVVLEMSGHTCRKASIVLGAIAPVPLRARASEALLVGHTVDEPGADAAARAAVAGATPLTKNGYKVQVFQAVVRRTILAAAGGAS